MRWIGGAIVHRINRIARIHHDKRTEFPLDLLVQGTRDAGEGGVTPVTWPTPWRVTCLASAAGGGLMPVRQCPSDGAEGGGELAEFGPGGVAGDHEGEPGRAGAVHRPLAAGGGVADVPGLRVDRGRRERGAVVGHP